MPSIVNDLIFSITTVLPIFLLIVLGFVLRKRNTVDDHFVDTISTLVFYYALPASMFLDVAKSDVHNLLNLRFILVSVGGTLIVFSIDWFVAAHTIKDRGTIAAVVHGGYRGNYVYIGLPIIMNILQTNSVSTSVLIVTFALPVYNILGVFILSYYSGEMSRMNPDLQPVFSMPIQDCLCPALSIKPSHPWAALQPLWP